MIIPIYTYTNDIHVYTHRGNALRIFKPLSVIPKIGRPILSLFFILYQYVHIYIFINIYVYVYTYTQYICVCMCIYINSVERFVNISVSVKYWFFPRPPDDRRYRRRLRCRPIVARVLFGHPFLLNTRLFRSPRKCQLDSLNARTPIPRWSIGYGWYWRL